MESLARPVTSLVSQWSHWLGRATSDSTGCLLLWYAATIHAPYMSGVWGGSNTVFFQRVDYTQIMCLTDPEATAQGIPTLTCG